jgi:hypothetical protein
MLMDSWEEAFFMLKTVCFVTLPQHKMRWVIINIIKHQLENIKNADSSFSLESAHKKDQILLIICASAIQ